MFDVAITAVTANPSKYANAADGTYGVVRSTLIDNASEYGLTYDANAEEGSKFTVTNASTFVNHDSHSMIHRLIWLQLMLNIYNHCFLNVVLLHKRYCN